MSILAIALLLLPGLAWWAWLGKRDRDPLVSLALIAGISLASIILLAEFVFVLGGSFSPLGIGLLLAGFAVLATFGLIRNKPKLPHKYRWHLVIGLVLFGLVIAWRLYQARGLLLPNWVDSQHHYLIIRVILEQKGLPDTLAPYLDQPFYYHYGFHAVTALFTALSGLEIGQAMLIFGQVLNAAIALSVYTLGKALWKDWRPAAAAALLVSFATRMPAYYLSWGRYTLTTGLVLLPLAMMVAIRLLEKPTRKADIITLAVLTGGVLLSHYFAAVLLAIFLVILGIVFFIPRLKTALTALVDFSSVIIGTILGLGLAIPWLLRVARFSPSSAGIVSNLPPTLSDIEVSSDTAHYIWQLLGPAGNHWLLATAGVGLIWAIIRRKQVAFWIWAMVCGLLTLPWSVTLKPFRPDHFAIVLFLPVAIFAGWLFWQIGQQLSKWLKRDWISIILPGLLVVGWITWDFNLSVNIVNSVTVLVTADDIEALDWVHENTPEEARFFINTAYWQNGNYRGVDGGGWLLPYTGRWSLVPTVFYGFSPDQEVTEELVRWGREANKISTCDEAFWALVEEANLDWVYVREGVGSLQPEGLSGCAGVEEVYANDAVSLFQITRSSP